MARWALRQRVSARLLEKLHQCLRELQPKVLPKSPSGAAVRYARNQWGALTRFLEDGDLEIDNGRHGTGQSRHRAGPRQLDVPGQRRRRPNGRGIAELHRFLQAVRRRAVCLVPGCALAHPGALHDPAERVASAQLEAARRTRPDLIRGPPARQKSRATYLRGK